MRQQGKIYLVFSEELVLTFSVKDQLAFLGRQLLSGKLVVLKGGGGGGEGKGK